MGVLDRFRLDGRVAVVTGGTKGLGRAMAEGMAEVGGQCVLLSRHGDEAQAEAAAIRAKTGQRCAGYGCDVTNAEQVEATVGAILAEFGQIDVLVNNAGINIRGPIDKLSLDEFELVQQINVTGPWLMCKAVSAHMRERRYGRVINIGSTLSVIALADRTPYCSSKGAILMMTKALAMEWAPYGITVNAMLPGPFATEMNVPILDNPEMYKTFIAKVPLGRFGELEEIQGLAVFLASDASSFVTGATITVDGGWTVY